MNNLDKQYQELLQDILDNGIRKEDRTGTGTLSVFGRQIRHKMSEGFPLLTTKKMYWKGIVTELLWFLRGDTNIKYLVDNDCHIWDGDAYRNYCEQQARKLIQGCTYQEFVEKIKTDDEFAKKWGDLGPVYGKQWRKWETYSPYQKIGTYEDGTGVYTYKKNTNIDQIANLINDLKTNPDSRRLMVSAWNVSELDKMTLPPCHYGFQVYTRELSSGERASIMDEKIGITKDERLLPYLTSDLEKHNIPARTISLMYNARSQDVPLGTPFNLASYGLLLEIIAKEVNMVPDELITNMGDCHIYLNQIDGVKEQLTREPYELPKLMCKDEYWYLNDVDITFSEKIEKFKTDFFKVENYQSHPTIKMPLSN